MLALGSAFLLFFAAAHWSRVGHLNKVVIAALIAAATLNAAAAGAALGL